MSESYRFNWLAQLAAVILALSTAVADAGAGEVASHACHPNDSIVMGKRLAPNPAVVEARLKSPACRQASASENSSQEDAATQLQALDRIDRTLTGLLREATN